MRAALTQLEYYQWDHILQSMGSRKLPVLRLLLIPPAALFAYSAFCYYREQYYEAKEKQEQSIKIIKQLFDKSEKAKTTRELVVAYQTINKVTSMMITDPSLRAWKVLNSKADMMEDRSFWSSRYRIEKDIQNNLFNFQRVIKQGLFSVGFWTNILETNLYKIDDTQRFEKIIRKAYDRRDKRCSQIAENYASNFQRGYEEVLGECLDQTMKSRAALGRELDLIKKMLEHQPLF